MKTGYQLNASLVFKKMEKETIVVELDSGTFYHFNPATHDFLQHFKKPQSLEQVLGHPQIKNSEEEKKYIKNFCKFLQAHAILDETEMKSQDEGDAGAPPSSYERPSFLKQGDKKLSEMVFLCP